MSTKPKAEMTWTKAIMICLGISAILVVTLGFIPSIFTYWYESHISDVVDLAQSTVGIEIEQYTAIRIRDAISMGYQSTVFGAIVAAVYIVMERRRRRLGLRGLDDVKGYLPGK